MELKNIDWIKLGICTVAFLIIAIPALMISIDAAPESYNVVINGDYTYTHNHGGLTDTIFASNASELETFLSSFSELKSNTP